MRWQVRFCKNALLGVLPISLQRRMRQLKRRAYPHRLELEEWTLEQGLRQVEMLRSAGLDPRGRRVLEIGTGWAPVIPLVFHLAGARSVTMVDRQRLMDDNTFRETCLQLLPHVPRIAERLCLDAAAVGERLGRIAGRSLEDGFASIGCSYLAPFDLLQEGLAVGGYDIITSRAVLEHIPPEKLMAIFRRAAVLLETGGAMCHIIDNSDHWEHNDKRISRVNFLRFGPRLFGLVSALNPLDYQNRLRHPEYLAMMRRAGFEVVHDASVPDPGAMRALKGMRVARTFRAFSQQELAVLVSNIVARKLPSADGKALSTAPEGGAPDMRATGSFG